MRTRRTNDDPDASTRALRDRDRRGVRWGWWGGWEWDLQDVRERFLRHGRELRELRRLRVPYGTAVLGKHLRHRPGPAVRGWEVPGGCLRDLRELRGGLRVRRRNAGVQRGVRRVRLEQPVDRDDPGDVGSRRAQRSAPPRTDQRDAHDGYVAAALRVS